MTRLHLLPSLAALALLVSACSSGDAAAGQSAAAATTAAAPAPGAEQTPDAGGSIIDVEMLTDDQGNNVFRPADFEARQGDVVRFTLVSGVHNVNFVADSGATSDFPPPSDMLQAPGQTYDLKVTQAPGRYFYQCDPHALLGMVGHMTVVER